MGVLEEIEQAAQAVAARLAPSVVTVGRHGGRGCGVVIGDGVVATNAHNLRGPELTVTFADGRQEVGSVSATDVDGDLAVVRVSTEGVASVPWATAPARLGQAVYVVGRSMLGGERVTFGLVSGTDREFRGPRGRRIRGSLEHTAPMPRGSSGSPVANAAGEVLGLNTNRIGEGFYLALPADDALRARLDSLAAGTSRSPRRLGVGLAPPHVAARLRRSVGLPERDGLLVRVVEEGSPAETAGIRQGDLLVAVDGAPLRSADDLGEALDAAEGAVRLLVVRGVEEVELVVDVTAVS